MKVLLVNDQGQLVAAMENVEQYDAGKSGDLLALMDFMEKLLLSAKGGGKQLGSAA